MSIEAQDRPETRVVTLVVIAGHLPIHAGANVFHAASIVAYWR